MNIQRHCALFLVGMLCCTEIAAQPADRGLAAPTLSGVPLRGVTLTDLPRSGAVGYSESDYADLGAMGVNITRLGMHLTRCDGCSTYSSSEAEIAYAEQILEMGQRYGFKLVVTLAPLPGGGKEEFWNDPQLRSSIAQQWQAIARRLKGYPALAAYDLINEPVPPGKSLREVHQQWDAFAAQLITALREVDPMHTIIFEPATWGNPSSFKSQEPLPFPNIAYSFHFYLPMTFTHQGVYPQYPYGVEYPNPTLNKDILSQTLEPVRDFQRRTGMPIYIGEFSAARWAPNDSAHRYLKDVISLFEAEHWSWTYLGWRGYHGWDAEIPETVPRDIKQSIAPEKRISTTPSFKLLSSYFMLNKPASH